MRYLFIIINITFLGLVTTTPGHTQGAAPTPPPGFNQGPLVPHDVRRPIRGELLIKPTKSARKQLRQEFIEKHGRRPSRRQINRQLARKLGLRISKEIPGSRAFFVKGVRTNLSKVEAARRAGLIELADSNFKVYAFEFDEIDDYIYKFGLLWSLNHPLGLFNNEFDLDVDAVEAWNVTTGNPNLIVGVIDTGVSLEHPDLAANIWNNPFERADGVDNDRNGYIDDTKGYNFHDNTNNADDDHFHGTHVAGTIAAIRNNGRGIAGIAPSVKILPLKVLGANGEGDTAALVKAVAYATELRRKGVNIRVLNASLGGGPKSSVMEDVLKEANRRGILFVAAAGNDNGNNDVTPVYPASYGTGIPNVVAVAASNFIGMKASFSNYGARTVHLAAPGTLIWAPIIGGLYLPSSGTSMAAPHVTGVAALAYSRFPNMTPSQMRDHLMNSTKPVSLLNGYMRSPGIVSAYLAVR